MTTLHKRKKNILIFFIIKCNLMCLKILKCNETIFCLYINIQYSLYLLSTHILLLINIADFIIYILFFLKDHI